MLRKILIIDDDPEDSDLMKDVLEGENIECAMASSPIEGLETAVSWKPDIILLDLMLPRMSGFGCLRELKKISSLAHVPIIVMTVLRDEDIAAASIDMGAAAYLSKDCTNEELISIIQEYAA